MRSWVEILSRSVSRRYRRGPPGKEPAGVLAEYEPIQGSVEQIVDAFGRFADMGCTRLELLAAGDQDETIEGLAPVIAALGRCT